MLSILADGVTVAEAARRAKVSEQSVGNWASRHARRHDRVSPGDRRPAAGIDILRILGEADSPH